jgi:hypothetical protein
MPTTVLNGHDTSGTTANRPTNCEPGATYFDTDLGALLTWSGTAWVANMASAAGAAGSGTTAGGAGAAATIAAGAGGAKAGTGAAAGGAGGAVTLTGGVGGDTANTSTSAGGAGGGVNLTAAAGGAATAGTGNGGAGGSVTLTPGAGGATTGGTAGTRGAIVLAGPVRSPVTAAQTVAGSGTITLPTTGRNKLLTTGGAVTGVILTAGRTDGEEVVLLNTSANSITFAAAGTSNVSNGTSAVIAANAAMKLIWDATGSRWYPV